MKARKASSRFHRDVAPVHVRNPDGIGIGGPVRGGRGSVCGREPSRFDRDGSRLWPRSRRLNTVQEHFSSDGSIVN